MFLSTGGKEPKAAGALSMCPRPLTTDCLGGLRPPGRGGHTPRGRGFFFRNIFPNKYELRALRRLRSR